MTTYKGWQGLPTATSDPGATISVSDGRVDSVCGTYPANKSGAPAANGSSVNAMPSYDAPLNGAHPSSGIALNGEPLSLSAPIDAYEKNIITDSILLPISGKRFFDIVFSASALLLLLPVFVLIAALVKFSSPGPILFSQSRYGRDRRLFRIRKFRTMYCNESRDASTSGNVIQAENNDKRLTPIGAFLRRTSLDELPQFWNVLRGDMSVVGPRPHAPLTVIGDFSYEDIVKEFDQRHAVRPGITGLAQIKGFNGPIADATAARNRFMRDIEYIEQASLFLDMKIVIRTMRREFLSRTYY